MCSVAARYVETQARAGALRMATRVQDVYDVLRAEEPQQASRKIALSILRDVAAGLSRVGPTVTIRRNALQDAERLLREMPLIVAAEPAPDDSGSSPVVDKLTAMYLVGREEPREAANRLAVELLKAVAEGRVRGSAEDTRPLSDNCPAFDVTGLIPHAPTLDSLD
jgi:hypothetical protein